MYTCIAHKQFIFSHIIALIIYNGIPQFMGKRSMLTVAQTMQHFSNFVVGKSSPQEIATLGIIREISDSNLEKSGDWEVWSKIWSLPDYLGELTAMRRGPTKQLFALDFF